MIDEWDEHVHADRYTNQKETESESEKKNHQNKGKRLRKKKTKEDGFDCKYFDSIIQDMKHTILILKICKLGE